MFPLGSLIFLKRPLDFPILLFFSISLHWSLRKAFLPLLAILWNTAFRWVYFSFSPLSFTSLLFSALSKASSDNHFAFFAFFFPWIRSWSLSPVQCHELGSIVLQALCLSDLIPWVYLSLLYWIYLSPTCQHRRHKTWLLSLVHEDPLEKSMATHSSIFAWRIP